MEQIKLPQEFVEQMRMILGEETNDFVKSYEMEELHALRFRNEKAQFAGLEIAEELGISSDDCVEWSPLSYYYDNAKRPGLHPFHEMGMFYIQEPSAMAPAAMLAPNPGERVLDLCAAPGGKSTELASFLNGEGLLVSNEIHPARAKILSSNIERMGIGNALVLNEDSASLKAHFPEFFHKILVDAPCSGEGMFRKNPDAILEWSTNNVLLCAARQAEILDNAAAMLMPGGDLLYSTCTFATEENEDTVKAFLERHNEFELIEDRRFWPHKERGEGHYMALFHRAGECSDYRYPNLAAGKLDKNKAKLVETFMKENLTDGALDLNRGYICFGDQIYLAPAECPNLTGLKVLRAGLHLGEIKKDRFEPAHALALCLDAEYFLRQFELTKEEAQAYLRGETKQGISLEKKDMGWCVLTFKGFVIGWGKASGNQIKNHYPKGLRKS